MAFGVVSPSTQAMAAEVDSTSEFYGTIDDLFENASELDGEDIVESVEGMESDYSGLNSLSNSDEIKAALKEYEAAKADYISGAKSKCSYGDDVLAEWKKQKSLTESMVPSGSSLKNFESVVTVTDVVDGDSGKSVVIYEWNAFSFSYSDDGSVESSGYGFNYTASFKKNKLKSIIDTESNYEEGNENSESCIYADVVSSADSSEDTTKIEFSYSADTAANYAQDHALNYNSDYRSFPRHDCANFVSQCLYSGGLPMNSKWNYYGYSNYTTSWSCAGGLMNYLSKYVGKLVDNCSASDISVGDPVFYWTGTRWGHVGICTKVDSHGNPKVCAHTNDRLNVDWDMYSKCRVVQIPSSKKYDSSEESDKSSESASKLKAEYNAQITFQGNAEITPKTFGGITVTYKDKEYKVSKISVDKENQRFQITELKKASDKVNKKIKKATKGENGLTYTVATYKVTDDSKVKVKYKDEKKKKLKYVKIKIAGEWYKADKDEYSFDYSSKTITFKGSNLSGIYTIK